MTDTHPGKARLRRDLRRRRQNLSPREQRAAAQALPRIIGDLPNWPGARRIALYLAADGEIDTAPLEQLARKQGKQVFLPVIRDDDSLGFARWNAHDPLPINRYNIPEPAAGAARCRVSDLDIIFLPVVGWDQLGGRLGMGGGFYDKTLAGITGPLLVGLAHANQRVDELPRDDWDIALDYIATDTGLHRSAAG
jgi:5-formyltetrahydrofolate cyclo-ligase